MRREWKKKIMYSFPGILLGAAVSFALLQIIFLVLTRKPAGAADMLAVFAVISSADLIFMGIGGGFLLHREGISRSNLFGGGLGTAWIAGNLLCCRLAVGTAIPPLMGRLAGALGCCGDFLMAGVLLSALVAAKHKPAYDKDFIIIPGCSISKDGGLLPLLKARTNRAIRFAWDQERAVGKPARYIPTGGQGPDEIMSEGSAMEFYLLSHGAEQYEVLPEKKSKNTWENMLFAKEIADAEMPGAKVCFTTTNYHVLRSGMLARRAGLDAEGLASSTKWYFWPNGLAREIVAIFSMYRIPAALVAAAVCAGALLGVL